MAAKKKSKSRSRKSGNRSTASKRRKTVKKKVTRSKARTAKKKSAAKKKKSVAKSKKKKPTSSSRARAKSKAKASKKKTTAKRSAKRAASKKKKSKAESTKAKSKASKQTDRIPKALPARRVSQSKVLPRNFLFEVAEAVKAAVVPQLMSGKGREIVGRSSSGDATFEIDHIAERALLNFLKKSQYPVAYYSEDSGYTTFSSGQPSNLLVIDPIDGTRAAKHGFEGCVVSVSSTRVIERPTMADIDNGLVTELMTDRAFYAERGKGARVYLNGSPRKPRLGKNEDWESLAWSMTVPARPAELIFPTAARLIDLSSLKGGFFSCNSTSFSITRLMTGQLDACVDIANRYYRDIPAAVEDYFINAGRGAILGICPYDFVAAILIAEEAGCAVTDAYGETFDDVLVLDSSVANHRSLIAASNSVLHEKLLNYFDTRIQQFEALLLQRHEAS